MRRALEEARGLGAVILAHEEDMALAHGGCINEGAVSAKLGVRGIPRESEEVMIARDGSIELIRRRQAPDQITANEVMPSFL